MFTGIIEAIGEVQSIHKEGSNIRLTIRAPFVEELKVDQSVAHNGVCLTVDAIELPYYTVVAVKETLDKTTLSSWKLGQEINLERGMKLSDRLDGHLVQGHVDSTATCIDIIRNEGSVDFTFKFSKQYASLMIEKGSICLDGISLTVFNVTKTTFTVTIIPYTLEHTNLKYINIGDALNVEFDVVGKYILRNQSLIQ